LVATGGLGLLLGALAAAQDGLEPPRPSRERGLAFTTPDDWRAAEPIDPERAAWIVRDPAGGPRLRVVLYRDRARRPLDERVGEWARAFEGPDGQPLPASAATREPLTPRDAAGVTATLVSLRGAFTGALEPGGEDRRRREGWAALHAVFEGPDGTWVASGVGPAAVVDRARPGFETLIREARVALVDAAPPALGAPQDTPQDVDEE
jgi:hypothetical protein